VGWLLEKRRKGPLLSKLSKDQKLKKQKMHNNISVPKYSKEGFILCEKQTLVATKKKEATLRVLKNTLSHC
jgi:hypothetical protein